MDGDYNDPATFKAIRRTLGGARQPAFYLAIPPALFGIVVEQLGKSGCVTEGARVIVEKPFGTDLVSAQRLNGILLGSFDEKRIFRIDHYLGKKPVHNMLFAYERVLGDAMAGDATLFAREDYVEEAWRIVDPVLRAGTPVFEYEPHTWGPTEVAKVTPLGGWHTPSLMVT